MSGCGSDDPAAAARARDLGTGLNPATPPVDTARQRADSQFITCLYVYDSEEKLRECLVLRFQWPTADAARRIAIYSAEMQRVTDSLLAVQRQRDSARFAQASREQAARDAERRRETAAREAQRKRGGSSG